MSPFESKSLVSSSRGPKERRSEPPHTRARAFDAHGVCSSDDDDRARVRASGERIGARVRERTRERQRRESWIGGAPRRERIDDSRDGGEWERVRARAGGCDGWC